MLFVLEAAIDRILKKSEERGRKRSPAPLHNPLILFGGNRLHSLETHGMASARGTLYLSIYLSIYVIYSLETETSRFLSPFTLRAHDPTDSLTSTITRALSHDCVGYTEQKSL